MWFSTLVLAVLAFGRDPDILGDTVNILFPDRAACWCWQWLAVAGL